VLPPARFAPWQAGIGEAVRHYLQVTDSDFERAARGDEKGGAESDAVLSQFAAQPASTTLSKKRPKPL